jgi:hypothetical protein
VTVTSTGLRPGDPPAVAAVSVLSTDYYNDFLYNLNLKPVAVGP